MNGMWTKRRKLNFQMVVGDNMERRRILSKDKERFSQ